jgi:hypothetical protein
MDGDERAEEGSAGLGSDDECRLEISERLGERRSQPTQDACVGPPPGGVGRPSGIRPTAAPLERRLEIAQKPARKRRVSDPDSDPWDPCPQSAVGNVPTASHASPQADLQRRHDLDVSGYVSIVDVGGEHGALLRRSWTAIRVRWECSSTSATWWRRPTGPSTGTSPMVVSRKWQATSPKRGHLAKTPTC